MTKQVHALVEYINEKESKYIKKCGFNPSVERNFLNRELLRSCVYSHDAASTFRQKPVLERE